MTAHFVPETRPHLIRNGWRLVVAPARLSLAGLRAAGAPFKGTKYFDQQAERTREMPFAGGEVAYRPGLMPDSLNRPYAHAAALVDDLRDRLPAGAHAIIAPAALYVWLLTEHHRQTGEWLLHQCYTWAADESDGTHLAVGIFGQMRPLLVSPIPEGSGRGVGVMPIVVPVGCASR
ncbi:MAG: hypothetical protein HY332_20885 [Chloroflexi bacterium]|nr:hypothetical protein [Chloroflexota bacterium]